MLIRYSRLARTIGYRARSHCESCQQARPQDRIGCRVCQQAGVVDGQQRARADRPQAEPGTGPTVDVGCHADAGQIRAAPPGEPAERRTGVAVWHRNLDGRDEFPARQRGLTGAKEEIVDRDAPASRLDRKRLPLPRRPAAAVRYRPQARHCRYCRPAWHDCGSGLRPRLSAAAASAGKYVRTWLSAAMSVSTVSALIDSQPSAISMAGRSSGIRLASTITRGVQLALAQGDDQVRSAGQQPSVAAAAIEDGHGLIQRSSGAHSRWRAWHVLT